MVSSHNQLNQLQKIFKDNSKIILISEAILAINKHSVTVRPKMSTTIRVRELRRIRSCISDDIADEGVNRNVNHFLPVFADISIQCVKVHLFRTRETLQMGYTLTHFSIIIQVGERIQEKAKKISKKQAGTI